MKPFHGAHLFGVKMSYKPLPKTAVLELVDQDVRSVPAAYDYERHAGAPMIALFGIDKN
jgi:hypothetical protein